MIEDTCAHSIFSILNIIVEETCHVEQQLVTTRRSDCSISAVEAIFNVVVARGLLPR